MLLPQPTPVVTRGDIERIVNRDFPADELEAVFSMLGEYGSEEWHRECDRVQLAALKLARGRLAGLRSAIDTAKRDYRDVLAHAEYPTYLQHMHMIELSESRQRQIIDNDWKQYQVWFQR